MKKHILTRVKYLFLLTGLFFAPLTALQRPDNIDIDSIVALLPHLHDDERLEAMVTLVNLTDGEPRRKRHVNILLEEARRQKDIHCEGYALTVEVELYGQQFSDSAIILAREAIRFTREHKLYEYLFLLQHQLITSYVDKGQLFSAIRAAEDGYAEARVINDDFLTARMLSAMGLVYNEMKLYEKSLLCYAESIELAAEHRHREPYLLIQNYDHLATLSNALKRYDDALRYADSLFMELERYRRNYPATDLQSFYFMAAHHRATAYLNMKQSSQAFEALQSARALFKPEWKETWLDARMDELYIHYYFATERYDEALEHIERALQFYVDNGLSGNQHSKRKNRAFALFQKGEYKTAAELFMQVIDNSDSLAHHHAYEQINELRAIYELDRAKIEAERRLEAIRRLRLTVAGLALFSAALTVIVALVMWNRRKMMDKNKALYCQIKERDNLTKKLKESEALAKVSISKTQQQLVARLNDYLLDNQNFAQQDLDYNEIAIQLATNRTSLFAAVKAVTGKTLLEYINGIRMDEARQLIETSTEPIDAIIEMCGFSSKSAFYRLFREQYNIPPKEYRKISNKNKLLSTSADTVLISS